MFFKSLSLNVHGHKVGSLLQDPAIYVHRKIVKRVGKGQESTTEEQGTERLVKYFFPSYIV